MSYRAPLNDSCHNTPLNTPEFTAPSLHPFECAFNGETIACDDEAFVSEFIDRVLVKLTTERYRRMDEHRQSVDLTFTHQANEEQQQQRQLQQQLLQEPEVLNSIILQLDKILRDPHLDRHFPVEISALECLECDERLGSLLLSYPTKFLPLVDVAILQFQEKMWECESNRQQVEEKVWTRKKNIHARLHSLPLVEERYWKRNLGTIQSSDVSHIVTLQGTVIRTGSIRMVETERQYECQKCQHRFLVGSDLDQGHTLNVPEQCPAPGRKRCRSSSFELVSGTSRARDFQRIKIQDAMMKLELGTLPKSIYVTLHDDLVDRCHAGDEVEIVGVIRRHWAGPFYKDNPCYCELYLDASHVKIKQERGKSESGLGLSVMTEKYLHDFKVHWSRGLNEDKELFYRNLIVSSFCPKLYGLFLVKLAVVLTIIGGVQHSSTTGTRVRGECHLLLVGDAGTGKSQLLKYAAKVTPRSILTTGMGTTSAGLTVATVKEPGGEWGLEAGALVLADGGVCCIDEFGCIRDHDRATIHEAMEQQTVSVAKAGLVCTLNTRTTVFGAMNPKGSYDHDADLSVNTSLATPLLSRFDLVLLMLDKHNHNWDEQVVGYIMDGLERPAEEEVQPLSKETFELERQQRIELTQFHPLTQGHGVRSEKEMRPWEIERLQAYIQYVRNNFFPILTPLAQRLLTRYYQYQRSADSRSAARTTIRLLESLVRLTQAHARLMWRHRATAQDACMAILVMETSLQSCSITSTRDSQFSLGSAFTKSADDPHGMDQGYHRQFELLKSKLDIAETPEEKAAELFAFEENERDLLGGEGTEAFERKRQHRAEQIRAEQDAREEARRRLQEKREEMERRPITFASIADATTFTPTSVHDITSSQGVSPHPNPIAPRSIPLVTYDPFGTSMQQSHVPALTTSQLQRFEAAAGRDHSTAPSTLSYRPSSVHSVQLDAISTAAAVSSSESSGMSNSKTAHSAPPVSNPPPAKRPRLGARRPHARPPKSPNQRDVEMIDEDDEDQSILVLKHIPPSKQDIRTTQRNSAPIRVKEEVVDEDVEMNFSTAAAASSTGPTRVLTTSTAFAVATTPATEVTSFGGASPPKTPLDPLKSLIESGLSKEVAESILKNPLRVAATVPANTITGETNRPSIPLTTHTQPQPQPQLQQQQQHRSPTSPPKQPLGPSISAPIPATTPQSVTLTSAQARLTAGPSSPAVTAASLRNSITLPASLPMPTSQPSISAVFQQQQQHSPSRSGLITAPHTSPTISANRGVGQQPASPFTPASALVKSSVTHAPVSPHSPMKQSPHFNQHHPTSHALPSPHAPIVPIPTGSNTVPAASSMHPLTVAPTHASTFNINSGSSIAPTPAIPPPPTIALSKPIILPTRKVPNRLPNSTTAPKLTLAPSTAVASDNFMNQPSMTGMSMAPPSSLLVPPTPLPLPLPAAASSSSTVSSHGPTSTAGAALLKLFQQLPSTAPRA